MQRRLVAIGLLVLAVPMAWLAWGFARDMRAHEQRIGSGNRLLDTASGAVEVAEAGKIDDPPLLVIHGSGGGFDQGLTLGSDYAARSYRVIVPSRFGLVFGCHLADSLIEEGEWSGADFRRGPR